MPIGICIRLVAIFVAIAVCGCSAYAPPQIDKETGLYKIEGKLSESASLRMDTSQDPRRFRFVLLNAESAYYQDQLEFAARQALADLGFMQVFNKSEFGSFVKMQQLSGKVAIQGPMSMSRISDMVGPFLIMNFSSVAYNDSDIVVKLNLMDASSGKRLLVVDDARYVWVSHDFEAYFPVLNEMRRWYMDSVRNESI